MSAARRVEFHPEALCEARAARDWYGTHELRAGVEFGEELDRAIERIAADPGTWPRHVTGTRRFLLRRFPFFVIYRELGMRIQVLAVAHARRRPGYWRSLIGPSSVPASRGSSMDLHGYDPPVPSMVSTAMRAPTIAYLVLASCQPPSAPASPAMEDIQGLSLDALIARLPLVGDEVRADPQARRFVEDPASADIARRMAEGAALTNEQWKGALSRTKAIQFRSIWPSEIPYAISVRVPAWLPATRLTLVARKPGWSAAHAGMLIPEDCLNCGMSRRRSASSTELGRLDPGRHHLEFEVSLEQGEVRRSVDHERVPEPARTLWEGTISMDVEVVSRFEDVFPPRHSVEMDEAVRRSLRLQSTTHPTVRGWEPVAALGLELSAADGFRFSTTSISLEVELWKGETLLETETATAHWDLPSPSIDGGGAPRRFVKPIVLAEAPRNALIEPGVLEGYSVRIRGRPDGVQRLLHADSWWDGQVTIPLADVAAEKHSSAR